MALRAARPISERKGLLVVLLVGLMTVAYSSIGIYTPAMPAIARYFDVPAAEVQFTFSIYIVSFAFGQLLYGPISDRFGRRPAIFLGLAIYILGSLLAVFSQSIQMLVIARLIQALGGCCGPVIGRAILRDLFDRNQGARLLSYVTMVMGAAPAFAPVIGGYLQVIFNWQSIFVLLVGIGALVLALNILFLDETYSRVHQTKSKGFFKVFQSYILFLRSAEFIGFTLVAAFAMSAVFVYSAGAPFLLIDLLGVRPDHYGWLLLIPTLCNLLGAFASARLVEKLGGDKMVVFGTIIVFLGGSLIFFLSVVLGLSIATIIGPMCIVMFGIAVLYPSAAQAAVSLFPEQAGTAASLNGFLHMLVSAAMVLVLGALVNTHQWAMIVLVMVCSLMALIALAPIFKKNRCQG